MAEFKSLKALKDFLEKSVKSAIKDEPPKAVKNLMKKHILRDVYMVYEQPKIYKRRLNNGGLMDENNIIFNNVDDYTVAVENITKRNMKYSEGYLTGLDQYLAPLIEFGHQKAVAKGLTGYTYAYSKYAYYHARPFIKNTRDSLIKNKSHVKAFQESLKRLGIKTK